MSEVCAGCFLAIVPDGKGGWKHASVEDQQFHDELAQLAAQARDASAGEAEME